MNADFTRDFSHQLRFWTLHVPLNALPSFIIAVSLFRFDRQPFAIFTMLIAIVLFIFVLSAITAMMPDLNRQGHPLARALRATMILRAWMSGLSAAMLVIAPPSMGIVPDFWCGYVSAALAGGISKSFHLASSTVTAGGSMPVFLTTVVEGLIIAICIAMITFFLCLYFQSRDRRKAFTSAGSPAPLR
jgi:hypothetical protein